jgi:calcineurin-like phosphoesterase
MQKTLPVQRFVSKMPTDRLTVADGPATVCGLYVETDDATGLARHAAPLRVGGKLAESWP